MQMPATFNLSIAIIKYFNSIYLVIFFIVQGLWYLVPKVSVTPDI